MRTRWSTQKVAGLSGIPFIYSPDPTLETLNLFLDPETVQHIFSLQEPISVPTRAAQGSEQKLSQRAQIQAAAGGNGTGVVPSKKAVQAPLQGLALAAELPRWWAEAPVPASGASQQLKQQV